MNETTADVERAPMVSIVMPTYNRAQLIGQSIASVIAQTYSNWELLVVDDGSNDATEQVVAAFGDPRIRYVRLEHTGSPGHARNTGIELSRGSFIAFLDSDDLWFPTKIELQTRRIRELGHVSAVACNALVLTSDGLRYEKQKPVAYLPSVRDLLMHGNPIWNSSVLAARSVFADVGPIDERKEVIEDYEYWLRLLARFPRSIYLMTETLVVYREHSGGISRHDSKDALERDEQRKSATIRQLETQFPVLVRRAQQRLKVGGARARSELDLQSGVLSLHRLVLFGQLSVGTKASVAFRFAVRSFVRHLRTLRAAREGTRG